MNNRSLGIILVILLFIGTILFSFLYGPSKRRYAIPGKTVPVQSSQELERVWLSSGVHGRVAVIFTRHLKQQTGGSFPETDYLDKAMGEGIVRKAYYIAPDGIWTSVVSENILNQDLIVPPKRTETGFLLLHRGGQIQVMPLSAYIPEQEKEKALVVIEPGAWTPQELFRIESFIRSGLLTSDLIVSIADSGKSK